jgi:predicted small lipoprotein YifL
VNQTFDRWLVKFAVLGVLVAALGLSACGRKAGLDPPPATSAVSADDAAGPVRADLGTDAEGKPVAPRTSQRKSFFLDWLLD